MKSFTLEIDELAALVGFLNAKKLVGLDESLFRAFSEQNVPRLVALLSAHGWMVPGERPETWHFNEDLMQALAVAVAPQFAVLARDPAARQSIVFYVADDEITEIVVTDAQAVVASLDGLDELAAQVMTFLHDARPGELLVARVKGDGFDAGRRTAVEGQVFRAEDVAAFVRGAMAELKIRR
jgi:hypothetical protein